MDANREEPIRQLFVGGLGIEITSKSLRDFFAQWGKVEKAVVKRSPLTNRSRGFGFVTYSESYMVHKALSNIPHRINNRDVETKLYVPREELNKSDVATIGKTIYVSGINEKSENDLFQHFGQFGTIDHVKIIILESLESGKKNVYGFVHFNDTDSAYKAFMNRTHIVAGKKLKVNKAFDRNEGAAAGYRGAYFRSKWGGIFLNETIGGYYNRSTGVGFNIYGNGGYGCYTNASDYYGIFRSNYPEYVNLGCGSYSWHIPQQPRTNNWGPNKFYDCSSIKSYMSNYRVTPYGYPGYRSMFVTGQQFIA